MRATNSAPNRSCGFVVAVGALTFATLPSAEGHGGAWWRPSAARLPVAIGSQTVPPPPITPALFRKFQVLLAGYEALGADASLSFAEWLVVNGITDPREFSCLMWLWWSHCSSGHRV